MGGVRVEFRNSLSLEAGYVPEVVLHFIPLKDASLAGKWLFDA